MKTTRIPLPSRSLDVGCSTFDVERSRAARRAFTLIELLTVIAIIGILAAIIIPTVGKVRETARAAHCMSNLRALQQAAIMAIENRRGKMLDRTNWKTIATESSIIPYLSLPKDGTGEDQPWPENIPSPLRCDATYRLRPTTGGYGRTYGINSFACATYKKEGQTEPEPLSNTPKTISDVANPSQMAFFMDGAARPGQTTDYWTYVRTQNIEGNSDNPPIQYAHKDGINVVFIDGHIRRLTQAEMKSVNYRTENQPFWGKIY